MSGELIAILAKCGGCKEVVRVEDAYFESEQTDSCPGCDGSGGQLTCLCLGYLRKTIEFTCVSCKFFNEIEVM